MDALKADDPSHLGMIRLRARLGHGAMGRVYYGVTGRGERVAVKVIRPGMLGTPSLRERFDREIEALGRAAGPGIAALADAAVPDEEPPWLAMEYIPGVTVKEYIERSGPLSTEAVAALGLAVADGLRDLHTAHLRHRDLKPGNIILGPDGPAIVDLGLVAIGDASTHLTTTGMAIGTPVCMAPEYIRDPEAATDAIDWYALGATLLYAATGHYPYSGASPQAVQWNAADPATPPDLSGLPGELAGVVTALLAADSGQRPGHARVVAELTGVPPMSPAELASLTYVAGTEPPAERTPAPPPRPRRAPSSVPGVVRRVAAQLRGAYAAGTAL